MGTLPAFRVTALVLAMASTPLAPAFAQDADVPLPPDSMVPDSMREDAAGATLPSQNTLPLPPGVENPHEVLGELSGGPAGSPTALRGNPLPGTSTSIPTTNPAPVLPLPERQGQVTERENTGIQGQCDPVVGLGNCPELFQDVVKPPASGAGPTAAEAQPAANDTPAADAGEAEKTGQ